MSINTGIFNYTNNFIPVFAARVPGWDIATTKELGVGIRVGANTNATQSGVSDNFKLTGNKGDYTLGFLKNQGFFLYN